MTALENNINNLDKIYNDNSDELKQIDRPEQDDGGGFGFLKILFLFLLLLFFVYSYFNFREPSDNKETIWYAVKLVSGEIFYGEIYDTKTDPIIIYNTYYNYDQDKELLGGGDLRLVKRGKEVQGGDGTMRIIRSQVLYMEPMKSDSKVLDAIRGYESNN